MNRSVDLTEALTNLEFNGKLNGLEVLFRKIEDVIFYLEAQGKVKMAEQLLACNWELKTRMQHDREEQWLWTFVWMKDKVLRKLGIDAQAEADLEVQAAEVQEFVGSCYTLSSVQHLLIGHSWERNSLLRIGNV